MGEEGFKPPIVFVDQMTEYGYRTNFESGLQKLTNGSKRVVKGTK